MKNFKSYGINNMNINEVPIDASFEELSIIGYTIIPNILNEEDLKTIRKKIEEIYEVQKKEIDFSLNKIKDEYVARLLCAYDNYFLNLITHEVALNYVRLALGSYFNLQLQNAIINPPSIDHHQSSWHRDLPYQEFTSSRPLAINALFCIHDFSNENGATEVLPFSHQLATPPSVDYFNKYKTILIAPAGSLIMMDSMLYHRAGVNRSENVRMAINQVYTSGIIKPQISFNKLINENSLKDPLLRMIFSIDNQIPNSVKEYRELRFKRNNL